MFAFSMVDAEGQLINDPKYVKLVAILQTISESGVRENKEIPFRDCKEEDLAKFYPIEEESQIKNIIR